MRNSHADTDSLGRRSRMRANSTGKRIRLTERDWLWLKAIHRHGPLASSFLLKYAKPLGMNEKRATERLTDLFHEDNTAHGGAYLKRPPQQFQTIDARYNLLVYDLAPAGIRALREAREWSDNSGPNGGPWWHSFMTSSITASIELETLVRSDLSLIPQAVILERAKATMSCPVPFVDPVTKKMVTKALKPDALFGLEYHTIKGSRFRFFAVEADRATEPLTSTSTSRKSAERMLAQYEALIVGRQYQTHYQLSAPLMLLFVTTNELRVKQSLTLTANNSSTLAPALLMQTWEAFAQPKAVPEPNTSLLGSAWQRTTGALHIDG